MFFVKSFMGATSHQFPPRSDLSFSRFLILAFSLCISVLSRFGATVAWSPPRVAWLPLEYHVVYRIGYYHYKYLLGSAIAEKPRLTVIWEWILATVSIKIIGEYG